MYQTPSTMVTEERKLGLVVLAWNQWELPGRCLQSRAETDWGGAEVVVVDNGSTDETPAGLAGLGWVRIVTLPRNLGFTGGNNAGIAPTVGSDVVLLNNDLIVPQRARLPPLPQRALEGPTLPRVGRRS